MCFVRFGSVPAGGDHGPAESVVSGSGDHNSGPGSMASSPGPASPRSPRSGHHGGMLPPPPASCSSEEEGSDREQELALPQVGSKT